MDWLTLLLLVPLVVVPVVFLSGFAGCGFSNTAGPGPPAPSGLTVTAVGTDRIDLIWSWQDDPKVSPPRSPRFEILRTEMGQPPSPPIDAEASKTFSDMGLTPGTTYTYQVFAIVEVNFKSNGSNAQSAATLFAAFDDNQNNWANDCMVQRISAAGNLFNSGTKVRITLRGSTIDALMIETAYISQAASPGGPAGEAWDSAADLTQVKFGGNASVLLAAGTSVLSDETAYPFDHTKDLIIAFDIGPQGGARHGPKAGCQAYRRANIDQAAMANRSGFTAELANRVYLVEKIEVLS